MIIKFKKMHPNAVIPKKMREFDAGMDLRACESATIKAKSWGVVSTGLAMEMPADCEAQIRSRSGLAAKNGVFVLNSPGTIDAGYRGEIGVVLCNMADEDFVVNVGDRIAQMVIAKLCTYETLEDENLSNSARGTSGFGSTGVK